MGAICSKNGKIFYTHKFNKRFEQIDTINFIKQIIDKHKKKDICLFWDNASIHVGKDISEFLT